MICRDFKNAYLMELLAIGFYWLSGFSNKIKAVDLDQSWVKVHTSFFQNENYK